MTVPKAITSLLVANRGEIARRVIRTAREMGIRTVAVFSDADASEPHVREADRAVALGGHSATESYLDQAKILQAIRDTAVDAVHPGYGFLSENAQFARACADAGVVFVGPAPESVEIMGLKDRAKNLAQEAGVPVLPDLRITDDDPDSWLKGAERIGYPVLVKATAGGGGKGMRRVEKPEKLQEEIDGARREASNSFGNPDVFLERYLPAPRHVEVQVFGDTHGNAVHLFERECSVQRRHQKVIEEAPSPAVDDDLRQKMGETAVALVKQLGYVGAGTVEFLLDDSGPDARFYFLEMNTRLQVEHPVTEEITGLDLVRLQLQVAGGLPLGFEQDDIRRRGHAIEVRLYAEDPAHDFAPTPGRLHRYRCSSGPGVRWENGIGEHGEITPFYDPLLAKVIAHAGTRAEAALRLSRALDDTEIHGTTTNRDFLSAALRSPAFLAGDTHTDFIDLNPELTTAGPSTPEVVHLAAAVAVSVAARRRTDTLTREVRPGFRILPDHPLPHAVWESATSGAEVRFSYDLDADTGDATLRLDTDGDPHTLSLRDLGPDSVRVRLNDQEWPCRVVVHPDDSIWVNDPDGQRGWKPRPRLPESTTQTGAQGPAVDMAGVVAAILVEPGDEVSIGDRLLVVEAMKMERPVLADAVGTVESVHVQVGDYVDAQTRLISLAAQ